MKTILLFFSIILLFSCSLHEKKSISKISEFYDFDNKYPSYYFGNENTRISQSHKDTVFPSLPQHVLISLEKYYIQQVDIKGMVYVNPMNSYISNWKENLDKQSYFYLNAFDFKAWYSQKYIFLPASLRSYLNYTDFEVNDSTFRLHLKPDFDVPYEKYLTPFYFKQREVSNLEYREFVHWIKDSIARTILVKKGFKEFNISKDTTTIRLNWKTKLDYEDTLYLRALEELYYPQSPRFYKRRELKYASFEYKIENQISNQELPNSVFVYPDTLSFLRDYIEPSHDPLVNMYFWHPAYDYYPIVGITYYQALAFLSWKEKRMNQQLKAEGKNYSIKLELPTEAQWDMISSAKKVNNEVIIFPSDYFQYENTSWLTDLSLSYDQSDQLRKTMNHGLWNCDSIINAEQHLYGNLKDKRNQNQTDVSVYKNRVDVYFLNGNVSEWLQDDYLQSWERVFQKRNKLMLASTDESTKIAAQIENHYNSKNDINGKLVCGANWLDLRCQSNRMKEAMYVKKYLDPHKSHATLGFRYVVYVYK
jgi:formylglycine-generating enzyme required for sulfatase activity